MKVLMLSKHGDGLGIAHKLAQEGHNVAVFIQDSAYKRGGLGIVRRVKSWRPELLAADLVLCDMVGFGAYERTLRRFSAPVMGCSRIADMLELDRSKGHDLLQRLGIKTPETFTFKRPADAVVLEASWEPPGYVLKPSGNADTSKTVLVREPSGLRWALEQMPDRPLLVQRIVEGVEVSTEGWFNGRDWVLPFNHTFEEKRLMPGGLGPNTGCMGNVVLATQSNELTRQTVERLTPFLRQIGYRGPIDLNAIVNSMGAHVLEITPRFGYDAIEALTEGLREPLGDLLFEVAAGVKHEMDLPTREPMIAVRLSVPPWPHGEPSEADAGMPLLGLNSENLKHIALTDAMREGDSYLYAAGDGVVAKVTARGRTVEEARRRAYRTIRNLSIQDVQYRTDIGSRVNRDWKQLAEWGFVDA